jgi:trimethylamine:corrinoid methyltransferase-like protein
MEKHTTRHMRAGELVRPSVFDRDQHELWLATGRRTLEDRARERALAILETHSFSPLADDVEAELRRIVARADNESA